MMVATMARGAAVVLSDRKRDEVEAVARIPPRLPSDNLPEEKHSFRRRFCGVRFHGGIFIGAPARIRLFETRRSLRYLHIPIISGRSPLAP